MSAETADFATLAETVAEAWALYNRLLSGGLVIGCGMFFGRAIAAAAVAGGFELGLSSAAKTVRLLSHAERIHYWNTAVEDAVLASSDPPTAKDVCVVYARAAVLAGACAAACASLEEGPE